MTSVGYLAATWPRRIAAARMFRISAARVPAMPSQQMSEAEGVPLGLTSVGFVEAYLGVLSLKDSHPVA